MNAEGMWVGGEFCFWLSGSFESGQSRRRDLPAIQRLAQINKGLCGPIVTLISAELGDKNNFAAAGQPADAECIAVMVDRLGKNVLVLHNGSQKLLLVAKG